ncbi:MAG TPA: fluoride efflux transporter CrcB [Thermodesulfobacteriota bacterium]
MTPAGHYLLVALGGAIGSLLRVLASQALAQRFGVGFPYGTFAVNVTGSFLIGVAAGVLAPRLSLAPGAWALLVPGFLGGYTTFSAFEMETLSLLRGGAPGRALLYVGASVVIGLFACWTGLRLASRLTAE